MCLCRYPCAPQRNDLVFSEPHEAFYASLLAAAQRPLQRATEVTQWAPSREQLAAIEAEEVGALQLARHKVAQVASQYKRQLAATDAGM